MESFTLAKCISHALNHSLVQQTDLSLLGHGPEVGIPSRLVAHLPTTTAYVTEGQRGLPGIVQGDLQKDRGFV